MASLFRAGRNGIIIDYFWVGHPLTQASFIILNNIVTAKVGFLQRGCAASARAGNRNLNYPSWWHVNLAQICGGGGGLLGVGRTNAITGGLIVLVRFIGVNATEWDEGVKKIMS